MLEVTKVARFKAAENNCCYIFMIPQYIVLNVIATVLFSRNSCAIDADLTKLRIGLPIDFLEEYRKASFLFTNNEFCH